MPLVVQYVGVPPATAEQMLGISHKKICDLLNGGQLDSYSVGRARRITVESIRAYVARQLEHF